MRIIVSSLFVLILASSSHGQVRRANVDVDVIPLYRDSGVVTLEVYYSLLQRDIGLKESQTENNRWSATINSKISVFQGDKVLITHPLSKTLSLTATRDEIYMNSMQYIIDVVPLSMKYASNLLLKFEVTLTDSAGRPFSEVIEKPISLVSKGSEGSFFSGVCLASALHETGKNDSPFEKSGYYITANPSNTFGGEYNKLHYYTELYLFGVDLNTSDSIKIITTILDPSLKVMYTQSQMVPMYDKTTPLLASVPIDGLPSDSYYLSITAEKSTVQIAKTQKVFYVESDMIVSEEPSGSDVSQLDERTIFESSDIMQMSDVELTDKINQASYILPDDVRKSLTTQSDLSSKRRLFFDFWRKQDQPNIRPLTAYMDYFNRVKYANQKFGYQKTMGWKTDRGRVYITYGAPDKEEKELFSTQAKPYMQWQYIGRGYRLTEGSRAFFYFVDKMGGGNFVLVHSNVMGEISNPNWYSMDALQIR
jgi:GWxTD domain-containing protein